MAMHVRHAPLPRPGPPGFVKHLEVVGVVRDEDPPLAGGERQLADIGCALAAELGSDDDIVAVCPKRAGERARNVLVEVERPGFVQFLPPLPLEVFPAEQKECVDVFGIGPVVVDRRLDGRLG